MYNDYDSGSDTSSDTGSDMSSDTGSDMSSDTGSDTSSDSDTSDTATSDTSNDVDSANNENSDNYTVSEAPAETDITQAHPAEGELEQLENYNDTGSDTAAEADDVDTIMGACADDFQQFEAPENDDASDLASPTIAVDQAEQWHAGVNAIENNIEAMRDDMRDKDIKDEAYIEQMATQERLNQMEELSRNLEGDFSSSDAQPDLNAAAEAQADTPAELHETDAPVADAPVDAIVPAEPPVADVPIDADVPAEPPVADAPIDADVPAEQTVEDVPVNADVPTEVITPEDIQRDWAEIQCDAANDAAAIELNESTAVSENIDYAAIYDAIDEERGGHDFDGIDYLSDHARLDSSLDSFSDKNWEALSADGKKSALEDLKGYVQEVAGLKDAPTIVYYNKPDCSDYGAYNSARNTLEINTYSLEKHPETPRDVNVAQEAADTVAHELWHAYQHQRAENPRSGVSGSLDYQRQYGLDHYISPRHNANGQCVNFEAYQDQLVESEARAFADQFKGRLEEIIGRTR